MKKILVWDLPTRVGHWLLVASFAVAWLSGDSEEWRLVHVAAGYTMVAVLAFRIFWGIAGTRYARFTSFLFSPRQARDYLTGLLRGENSHWVGHNPAGSYAIYLLILLGFATAGSGWLAYNEFGGEWLHAHKRCEHQRRHEEGPTVRQTRFDAGHRFASLSLDHTAGGGEQQKPVRGAGDHAAAHGGQQQKGRIDEQQAGDLRPDAGGRALDVIRNGAFRAFIDAPAALGAREARFAFSDTLAVDGESWADALTAAALHASYRIDADVEDVELVGEGLKCPHRAEQAALRPAFRKEGQDDHQAHKERHKDHRLHQDRCGSHGLEFRDRLEGT